MHPELGQVQRSWKRRLSWLRHCHIPYSHRIALRIWLSGLGTGVCLQSLGMASVFSNMSAEPAGGSMRPLVPAALLSRRPVNHGWSAPSTAGLNVSSGQADWYRSALQIPASVGLGIALCDSLCSSLTALSWMSLA